MTAHAFLLKEHTWLGDGKIQLNTVPEELGFVTRWTISPADVEGRIACIQEIQVKGISEIMHNEFVLFAFTPSSFLIELENQSLGRVMGKGIISDSTIGWEFRVPDIGFEGYEYYERKEDGSYLVHAEYATDDSFRTEIKGKVWIPASKETL